MKQKRILALILVAGLLSVLPAAAAEVESGDVYCFTAGDFSEQALQGVCITGLPENSLGTVFLGSRVIRCGDILTAGDLEKLEFRPARTQTDAVATLSYLPIYENRVEKAATVTISIRGKADKAPDAQDSALETYKNMERQGTLRVSDPEGEALIYTVIRAPRRGQVTVNPDGTFLYTPKHNKVGVDSFTYTATDPAGNVSREATVTIQILKPTDSTAYSDMDSSSHRFAAEWLKNTGLFVGEQVGGKLCFREDSPVTRGEFIAMLTRVLNIPLDDDLKAEGYTDEIPGWLRPFLSAALRSGLTSGLPKKANGAFGADEQILSEEAAVVLQNVLDLDVSAAAQGNSALIEAMACQEIFLSEGSALHRGECAEVLYRVSRLVAENSALWMFQ